MTEEEEQAAEPSQADKEAEGAADTAQSVKRGSMVIAGLIGLSLLWYLLADRFTPYTDQARIQGYVVGVAPQVNGIVRRKYSYFPRIIPDPLLIYSPKRMSFFWPSQTLGYEYSN